ncbi:NADPH-dependent 1-acyldihydroxyacetone phosphate reductase [Purpureocillium lavendulum]|uniref:NADPH-dependent 1-acyldihydroxyacetone phosphate reductase n=1 Tax=Purpureocillium lavendulum TaxID=1247861 RepID=A0AB34FZT6_9HYPO|nr:NADPH-dependent 1-acyldihydroxyacetone phosphate reductase [Purpureocillium lavendulum]
MSNPPTAGPGACPGQKVALVTGATPGGIGGALAIQLHKAGFFVVCALRRPSVAESILQPGLVAVALDVASSASVTSAAKEVSSLTDGRLDLLINNAGVATHLPALDLDVDGMVNDMFNVNVLGVMRMVKAFSPLLINSKGTVVNIGSVAPLVPLPFSTAYNATKAALHAYGDGLRMELALFGVKVITIITGGVKSNIVGPSSTSNADQIAAERRLHLNRFPIANFFAMPNLSASTRPRSEAQMAQKRRGDRIKHQANRAENKLRMQKMEEDIAFLRASMTDVLAQLRSASLGSSGPPCHVPSPMALAYHHPVQVSTNPFGTLGVEWDAVSPFSCASATRVGTPVVPPGLLFGCRCGIPHQDQSYCAEYASFSVLYQPHVTLLQQPCLDPAHLPRTPSLENLLLNTNYDNPLSSCLGRILRCFEAPNIETLFGVHLLVYRFLKWRLYPSIETLRDVPTWLRPTKVQESCPHPVCIDYIPWPSLRDYLCLHQNQDLRHTTQMGPQGGVTIDKEFEAIATDITKWSMGSPWIETFPHLIQHVTCETRNLEA